MQFKIQPLSWTTLGIGLATLVLLGNSPIRAQVVPEAASEAAAREFDTDNPNDTNNIFDGRDTNGSSVLNLMNKLQNLNFYTPTAQENRDMINGAANEFRRKQRERESLQNSAVDAPAVVSPTE